MANLQHIKASRTQILNNFPSNTLGNDGDIVVVNIKGKGSYLCIKNNGRWFAANKLNDIRELDKPQLENLKVDSLEIKSAKLDTGKRNGDFTLDAHGNIELNTDNGRLSIKDGSDSHFFFDCDNTSFIIYDDQDTGDLYKIQVSQHGATTISTIDDDATAGHLTMQPDGDLVLDPASQKTIINATDGLYFDGGTHTNISESSDDTLRFIVGGTNLVDMTEAATNSVNINNSELTIDAAKKLYFDSSTLGHTYITESSADVLDVYVGGDKMLTLDEANDRISLNATKHVAGLADGTEFSVANSSYAGMILGYRCIGEDATHASYTLTTSYAVPHADMTTRFIAPPSGAVEVMVQIFMNSSTSNKFLYLGLSDNSTYNSIGVQYEHNAQYPDETDDGTIQHFWTVTGLTAGTTYNYWLGAKTSGTNKFLNWGGDATGRYPDFIMKVTALPAAASDFAVYG